jgi:transcriptional regulator with XRE-family HTH domain
MIDVAYLERERLKNGETQTELAGRLGISPTAYAGIVGRKSAKPSTIKKMITCLRLDPDKLIPDPKEEQPVGG